MAGYRSCIRSGSPMAVTSAAKKPHRRDIAERGGDAVGRPVDMGREGRPAEGARQRGGLVHADPRRPGQEGIRMPGDGILPVEDKLFSKDFRLVF